MPLACLLKVSNGCLKMTRSLWLCFTALNQDVLTFNLNFMVSTMSSPFTEKIWPHNPKLRFSCPNQPSHCNSRHLKGLKEHKEKRLVSKQRSESRGWRARSRLCSAPRRVSTRRPSSASFFLALAFSLPKPQPTRSKLSLASSRLYNTS